MTQEQIIIEDDVLDIEVKPLTLVFNAGPKEIVYQDRISITPEVTLQHFESMDIIDPYSACLFRIIVDDYPFPVTKSQIQKSVLAFKHIIGLFSFSLKLMVENKKFVWKHPESFLHPKYQGNIADALILMSDTNTFVRFLEFVRMGYFDDFILGQDNKVQKLYDKFRSLKA